MTFPRTWALGFEPHLRNKQGKKERINKYISKEKGHTYPSEDDDVEAGGDERGALHDGAEEHHEQLLGKGSAGLAQSGAEYVDGGLALRLTVRILLCRWIHGLIDTMIDGSKGE